MKRIKYFIASAGSLKEERESIETYLSRKNDLLIDEGIYVEVVIWEKLSSSFSPERIQNEFNNQLLKCDVMLCLAFDKVGPFTYEEFSNAVKNFKNGGNPKKIYMYFKDAPIKSSKITSDFQSVLELKKEIKSMEQYPVDYSNVAELLLDIEKNFKIDYQSFTEISIREQVETLLQSINPNIIESFQNGINELNVFITQENLLLFNKIIQDLTKLRLIELIDKGSTMIGFGTLPSGTISDCTQNQSSQCRLHTIRKLENY